jgi:osmotically-inducible protein OsmY
MRISGLTAVVPSGVLIFLLSILPTISAQSSPTGSTASDNSSINQRDRNSSEPTADQQKENNSDLQMTQQIRQALVKDKSLSSYGHNIKVIAQNGKVTLKGPVHTEQEKNTIISKAAAIAGQSNVTDEIDVVAQNK